MNRHRPERRTQLRIVAGKLRGRRLTYSLDPDVRPMKDRTREAVFNVLGPTVAGTEVWDLFAGTGALGIEAISRGAALAWLVECHRPTARIIQQNVTALELQDLARVIGSDVFDWLPAAVKRASAEGEPSRPWLVFCCPPYAFYHERLADLQQLLQRAYEAAPVGSTLVVEAPRPFDFTTFWPGDWSVRDYTPASIGMLDKS